VSVDHSPKPLSEWTLTEEEDLTEALRTPLSAPLIAKALAENAGAHSVEINVERGTFLFFYQSSTGHGVSCVGAEPWAILRDYKETAIDPDPRLDAEALFNKGDGYRYCGVTNEEAKQHAEQWNAVRRATGLAWRQLMLRHFDLAGSARAVLLYARVKEVTAPFEQLPADVWPLLEVVDWQNGIAVAPNRTTYWSIHVAPSPESHVVSTSASESAAIKALARHFVETHPDLTRDQARKWCHGQGFKLSQRGFQNRVWPGARKAAGLEATAQPGPKPKLRVEPKVGSKKTSIKRKPLIPWRGGVADTRLNDQAVSARTCRDRDRTHSSPAHHMQRRIFQRDRYHHMHVIRQQKSLFDPAFLRHHGPVREYGQHQPLNRQSERYAREGVDLSLSTLAD
jgi:hypothetical protein